MPETQASRAGRLQRLLWVALIVMPLLLLLALEGFARFGLGLGDPPLMEPSGEYGYRFQPNQDVRRFGNRVFYNGYGLRSEPMNAQSPRAVIRILCLGDSVTNGGALTDQVQTYPYILQDLLNKRGRDQFQVFNASAGSWGIANELAYLETEGFYGSRIVMLQLGVHDIWQKKSSAEIVGNNSNYPDKKPSFAVEELVGRYVTRYFAGPNGGAEVHAPMLRRSEIDLQGNLANLRRMVALVRRQDTELAVLLVPEPRHLQAVPPEVAKGERQLAQTLSSLDVPYRWLLEDFQRAERNGHAITTDGGGALEELRRALGGEIGGLFRDAVHPAPTGNRVMAEAAAKLITEAAAKLIAEALRLTQVARGD